MDYLVAMRKTSYYENALAASYGNSKVLSCAARRIYWGGKMIISKLKFKRLGLKLGFTIGEDVFGYGLVIGHYGTIVVGGSNRAGKFCVLHTSTCITDTGKTIGNALYLSTGAKMTKKIVLGDNVQVAANSLVNKSFPDGNCLLVGCPAFMGRSQGTWYDNEGGIYQERVRKVEELRMHQ